MGQQGWPTPPQSTLNLGRGRHWEADTIVSLLGKPFGVEQSAWGGELCSLIGHLGLAGWSCKRRFGLSAARRLA